METKKKKQLMNLIMVLLIVVIAGCGVMAVGSVKGWWKKGTDDSLLAAKTVTGIANIERSGIGYSLKSDMKIDKDDLIETKKGASVEIGGSAELSLGESSELTVKEATSSGIQLLLSQGELFSEFMAEKQENELTLGDHTAKTAKAILVADVRSGSVTLSVLSGSAEVTAKDGSSENVKEGESLSILTEEDNSVRMEKSSLQAASLSDFAIMQAKKSSGSLCLAATDLQKVLDDRASQKQAALEASLDSDKKIPREDSKKKTDEKNRQDKKTNESHPDEENIADSEHPEDSGYSEDADDTSYDDGDYDSADDTGEGGGDSSSQMSCTIEIRCDTILNNMSSLSSGKEGYVPSSGVILSTSSVEISEGDTVFDVLTRVCTYADIQLEYSWTPAYNSYYIEGINNLYQFDCGNESGWMYKVNGWYPNYGCSSYELEDGDAVVWSYTCNGLGADLGAGM